MYGFLVVAKTVRTADANRALRAYVRWEYGPGTDPWFLLALSDGRSRFRPRRSRARAILRGIHALWTGRAPGGRDVRGSPKALE